MRALLRPRKLLPCMCWSGLRTWYNVSCNSAFRVALSKVLQCLSVGRHFDVLRVAIMISLCFVNVLYSLAPFSSLLVDQMFN